jgi:hypothetical protein
MSKKIIQDVKDILLAEGWCQGELENANGEHCLLGACDKAFMPVPIRQAIFDKLGGCSIINWNDTPGRTLEEVVALLDEVASDYS